MSAGKLFFEQVELGDLIGPQDITVTREQVSQFITVLSARLPERNRFTDDEVARSEGLPGAIVPGTMCVAILSKHITDWSSTVTLHKIDAILRQLVPLNSPLRFIGVVTDKRPSDGGGEVECDVFIENDEGERVAGARAVLFLPAAAS